MASTSSFFDTFFTRLIPRSQLRRRRSTYAKGKSKGILNTSLAQAATPFTASQTPRHDSANRGDRLFPIWRRLSQRRDVHKQGPGEAVIQLKRGLLAAAFAGSLTLLQIYDSTGEVAKMDKSGRTLGCKYAYCLNMKVQNEFVTIWIYSFSADCIHVRMFSLSHQRAWQKLSPPAFSTAAQTLASLRPSLRRHCPEAPKTTPRGGSWLLGRDFIQRFCEQGTNLELAS